MNISYILNYISYRIEEEKEDFCRKAEGQGCPNWEGSTHKCREDAKLSRVWEEAQTPRYTEGRRSGREAEAGIRHRLLRAHAQRLRWIQTVLEEV